MKIIGHRGASGSYPENTIPSFIAAIDAGADGIELDVHLTKDGEIVVMHDYTVDRTTDGHGLVSSFTLSELKKLNAGAKWGKENVKIPTLAEVFDAIRDALFVIEVKRGSLMYPGIEEKLLSEIKRKSVKAQIISFDYDALNKLKSLSAGLETGMIFVGRPPYFLDMARQLGASWVHAPRDLVEQSDADYVRAKGLNFGVWGVNTDEEIRSAIDINPDSITTNFPERAVKLLAGLKRRSYFKFFVELGYWSASINS